MNTHAQIQKLILPALILITPFIVFLRYNSYCATCPETWIGFFGITAFALLCSLVIRARGRLVSSLVIAALITAFVDIQFTPPQWQAWINEWMAFLLFISLEMFCLCWVLKEKFYTIATAIFATFFTVTILQLALTAGKSDVLFEYKQPVPNSPPRIIHLVLDEHIGIDGIPTDIEGGLATQELITQFYLKNGFRLFGGAFSRYLDTHQSIPKMLNFSVGNKAGAVQTGTSYTLSNNSYFKLLTNKRYNLAVLSSEYLKFCFDTAVTACEYYSGTLHTFAKLDTPTSQKLQVLISRYLNQSIIVSSVIRKMVSSYRYLLPWSWALELDRTRLDSLNSLIILNSLWDNILSLPHGTALFAHLMLPHAPYIAKADCSIRPPHESFLWENRYSTGTHMNTVKSRGDRYQLYFEQLQCLYLKLDDLFKRMRELEIYDDSIIILHGDHGSRIFLTDPIAKKEHALTKQDLVDGFSTLFAVKLPRKPGGYDASPWALEELLAKFAFDAGLTPTNILPEKTEQFVYLTAGDDKEFIRVPYIPPN